MKEIKTERLVLKPVSKEYLDSIHRCISDRENIRYMLFLPTETLEQTREFVEDGEMEFKKDRPASYKFGVFFNDVHIGILLAFLDVEKTQADIGWIINPEYQGHGFAVEASRALVEFLLHEVGLTRLIAHCDIANVASRKVMEKLGMKFVDDCGTRRNKFSHDDSRECLFELCA